MHVLVLWLMRWISGWGPPISEELPPNNQTSRQNMAPRAASKSSPPLSDREKVLIGLLALTWLSIPLLLMHAGLDSHAPKRDAMLLARRALVEPAAAPVLSPPPPPPPSPSPSPPPSQVVDTKTTSLYHLFSAPVLASTEPIPKEDLDEVARIVLRQYHAIELNITKPGPDHLEQINNDFFTWQNDVDGGWVRARWSCRDREFREHNLSWDDRATIAFCDAEADRVSPRWPDLYKSKAFASVAATIWRALDTYLAAVGFGKDAVERGNTEFDAEGREYLWAWASVHVGGVLHYAHDHPRSLVSGTMYISLPGSAGNIYFRDPRRAFEQTEEKAALNYFQGVEIKVAPAQGLCLVFPPWITHGVEPTTGDTPRVAISFNLRGNWTYTIMGSAAATVVAGRTGAPGDRVGTAAGYTKMDPLGPKIFGPFVAEQGSTPADHGNI